MTLKPLKLLFHDIKDNSVRDNFRRLKNYMNEQKQFVGFQLLEFSVVSTGTNVLINHNLGFQPKDAVLTSVVGDGTIALNYGNFTNKAIDITVGGTVSRTNPTKVRVYIGTNVEGSVAL